MKMSLAMIRRLRKRVILFLFLFITLTVWLFEYLDTTNLDKLVRKSKRKHYPHYSARKNVDIQNPMLLGLAATEPQKDLSMLKSSQGYHDNLPWMASRSLSELENKVVPNQVFYVWCQNRTFTFNDYLSVLSAWKLLEPDSLEIHHDTDLRTDKYNQWFDELNRTVPAFTVQFVQRRESLCVNPLRYALEVLSDRGGVFVNFSAVLLKSIHDHRQMEFFAHFNEAGHVSFIVGATRSKIVRALLRRPNLGFAQTTFELREKAMNSGLCPSVSASLPLVSADVEYTCVTLSSELILKPLDLWGIRGGGLAMLRDLFYVDLQRGENFADASKPPGLKHNIPFIVHYVWFGRAEFSFRMYLSFLSTIHVARADRVFIHCDLYLTGHYWNTVSSHPRVTVVYREPPRHIYGHRVLYTQHRSDVLRADVLDKYGGIYMDWDVLWLRSPRALLTAGHETVVNLDHMARPPFPEALNLGVLLARPRARFVRLWRWALRHYRSMDFYYNALELPFRVYEKHPDTVYLEKRLQVMCFWLKCHPIFHPEYKDWLNAQPFNWRTDAYSIHFTHPDPAEYESIVDLINATGTFRDIGMYILEVSGELDVD